MNDTETGTVDQLEVDVMYTDMVEKLVKPGRDILITLTPEKVHMVHMVMGIAGEIGELIEAIALCDDKKILLECGDIEFYLEGFSHSLPEDIEPIAKVRDVIFPSPVQLLTVVGAELLDLVKKYFAYDKLIGPQQFANAWVEVRGALDLLYSQVRHLDRTVVRQGNRVKLADRYEGYQYSDAAAVSRKDVPVEDTAGLCHSDLSMEPDELPGSMQQLADDGPGHSELDELDSGPV